jgi:hypothetical protein
LRAVITGGEDLERPLGRGLFIVAVATPRTVLSLLGIGISLMGLPIAWWVDRIAGMALLVVGGFLIILPLTASTDEE